MNTWSQPARLGCRAHRLRARHDERLDVRRDVLAPDDARRLLEIRQAAVGARADERDVDLRARHARARASKPMNASASSSAFVGDRLADADRLARD